MKPIAFTRPVLRSARGAISCGHAAAATAGIEMLSAGGSAADAAAAAAAVLFVVAPQSCGPGGDALILVGSDRQETLAINGNGAAPELVPSKIPPDGGGTAAVPGAIAALLELHDRFGRLPRARVLMPAAALAGHGFVVGEDLHAALRGHTTRLRRTSSGWPLLDGKPGVGDLVQLPRLSELLRAVGEGGHREFYCGAPAVAMAAAAQADGGTLTSGDIEGYSAIVTAPVSAEHWGARIEVTPPTSQAILLLLALARFADKAGSADRLREQVEAVEFAFRFRQDVARSDARTRLLEPDLEPSTAASAPRPFNHTAAVTVGDRHGQVVSMLVSVFDDFGGATFVPEYEFHLNSRLLGFDDDGPNAPSGRSRPVHTLSPALVRQGHRILAIATPGADGQVQTLLQVLTSVLADGASLQSVLHRARWRLVGRELHIEQGFPESPLAELRRDGRPIHILPAGDQLFGAIAAVDVDARTGSVRAMSDPRREAWAAVA